jgi:hypothetical protein
MARMPSALALLETPVRAVVMDTDGTVYAFVGLLACSVMMRSSPWLLFMVSLA